MSNKTNGSDQLSNYACKYCGGELAIDEEYHQSNGQYETGRLALQELSVYCVNPDCEEVGLFDEIAEKRVNEFMAIGKAKVISKTEKAFRNFEEILNTLIKDAGSAAGSYDWGSHNSGMDDDVEKAKIILCGLYKEAIGNNPGKTCQNCDGTGVVETSDSESYGSTTVQRKSAFKCDTLSDGKCCKCGGNLNEKFHVCEDCGFDWSTEN